MKIVEKDLKWLDEQESQIEEVEKSLAGVSGTQ